MRLLLDESLPRPLADLLAGHEVRTVTQMGWTSVRNGALLRQHPRSRNFMPVKIELFDELVGGIGFGTSLGSYYPLMSQMRPAAARCVGRRVPVGAPRRKRSVPMRTTRAFLEFESLLIHGVMPLHDRRQQNQA